MFLVGNDFVFVLGFRMARKGHDFHFRQFLFFLLQMIDQQIS